MSDLAITVLWPLVAVVLVLCGATFATSGRAAQSAGSAVAATGASSRAGRRTTDHLPGDRMMVVIAAGDNQETVRSAVQAAQRAGTGVTIINDVSSAASTYGRHGSFDRHAPAGTARRYA